MKATIVILILAAVAVSAVFYPRLPQEMPTHWNSAGQVDDTMAKPWGPFLGPLIMTVLAAVFLALPRLAPKGYEIEEKARFYRAITLAMVVFMFAVHCIVIAMALGVPIRISIALPVLVGLLFAVMGNYLTKVPRNFFIGVRTPWTLADEDVWFRTHRLASRLFVAAGLVIAIGVPLAGERFALAVMLSAVAVAAVVPIVYSYAIYKRSAAHQNSAGS